MIDEKKPMTEIMSGNSKIIDRKLTRAKDYGQWKHTITTYVNNLDLGDHLSGSAFPQSGVDNRKNGK